jgi:hypothetical protein
MFGAAAVAISMMVDHMQFVINIITQLQSLHAVHDASSISRCSAVHCFAAVAISTMVDHSPAGRQYFSNIITQLQPLHAVHDASSISQCSAVHCLAAVAMSMMVDHSPAGRARHPANMPKIMIYEPDEYSNQRILD